MCRFYTEGFTKTLLYRQDYAGSLEYRFTTANGLQPEAAYFGDGRVAFIENYRRYEYYLKDHLGNIRLTFTDKNNNGVVDVNNTATNEILQENHYSPFGMDQSGPWMNDAALDNAYKYNGKELNTDFGLQWMDYGARWYDRALGRWWSIDPLSTMYNSHSPFHFSVNNPISFVDIDGMSSTRDVYVDEDDNVIHVIEDGDNRDHYYRASQDESGYISVTEDLGVGYVTRSQALSSSSNWLNRATIATQNYPSRTQPAVHMYEFADRAPMDLFNIVSTLFLVEGAVGATAWSIPRVAGLFGNKSAIVLSGQRLTLRPDIILSGGRSGEKVKNIVTVANSVVKGSNGRIYITDDLGRVVWDVTKDRMKAVASGQGFVGDKVRAVPQEYLDAIIKIWGK